VLLEFPNERKARVKGRAASIAVPLLRLPPLLLLLSLLQPCTASHSERRRLLLWRP
jgi:hypothetical protein